MGDLKMQGMLCRGSEILRKQVTNYKGHSFLSRFLLFGVGGWLYKKHPHIVDALFSAVTSDLQDLFYNGVEIPMAGETFWVGVIALKGDMAFRKSTMSLTRSYANLTQSGNVAICHNCAAGSAGIQFEDLSEDPCWVGTMFQQRPWSTTPVLAGIPYDDSRPEQMMYNDIFHVHKLGVCRDPFGETWFPRLP